MPLALSPEYRLTEHSSSLELHSSRLAGSLRHVECISEGEAFVLALYDGTVEPSQLFSVMRGLGYSENDVASARAITGRFVEQSILVEVTEGSPSDSRERLDPERFLSGELDGGPRRRKLEVPLGFTLLATLSCNRSCIYCYAGARALSHEEPLPFSRLAQLIDEAATIGIKTVNGVFAFEGELPH